MLAHAARILEACCFMQLFQTEGSNLINCGIKVQRELMQVWGRSELKEFSDSMNLWTEGLDQGRR